MPSRHRLLRLTDVFGGVVYVDPANVACLYDLWEVEPQPQRARVDGHVGAAITQRKRLATQIVLRNTAVGQVNVSEKPDQVARLLEPDNPQIPAVEAPPLRGPDGNVRTLRQPGG